MPRLITGAFFCKQNVNILGEARFKMQGLVNIGRVQMHRSLIIVPLFLLAFGPGASCAAGGPGNAQSVQVPEKAMPQSGPQACAVMDVAADPRLLASAMLAGLNPKTYLNFIQRLSDPESVRNKLKDSTPQTTMDRAYSETDPEFQAALLSRATEPNMASKWQETMRDPAYFQSGVFVSNKPVQWMNVTADGRTAGPMMNWFDPKTYLGWIRLMTAPRAQDTKDSSGTNLSQAARPLVFAVPPQRY
jgi:hypothetical protein